MRDDDRTEGALRALLVTGSVPTPSVGSTLSDLEAVLGKAQCTVTARDSLEAVLREPADLLIVPPNDVEIARRIWPHATITAWVEGVPDPLAQTALLAGGDAILSLGAADLTLQAALVVRAALSNAQRQRRAPGERTVGEVEPARAVVAMSEAERVQSFESAVAEGIVVLQQDRILYANKAVARIIGVPVEAIEGRLVSDFVTLAEREQAEARMTGPDLRAELEFTHRDGSPRPVEVEVREGTWNGQTVSIATVRDLGAKRAWEAEENRRETEYRRQLEAQLRTIEESNARFELVARATNDVLYDWDVRTGTILWNDAVKHVLGFEGDLGNASMHWWTTRIHPDDIERVSTSLDSAMLSGHEAWTESYRFLPDTGAALDVIDRGIFVRSADGQCVRMIGAMTDVTKRKQLQTRLVLADRLAGIGTMAAGVAHELNNPLTWVLANIRLIEESVGHTLPPPVLRALDHAAQGAERMRSIISDLKVFSRNEPEAVRPVDVRATLHSALTMVRSDLDAVAELEHVDETVGSLLVLANEARLAQVFLNLLVNAVQSIPAGQPESNRVLVTVRATMDKVYIEVEDTGVGIPPGLRSQIFDAFFTTKPAGSGTGLGLSIGLQLAQAMGGDIELQSRSGRGSCFQVSLPRVATAPPPTQAVTLPPRNDAPTRLRVLVVDDEPMIVAMITETLQAEFDVYGDSSSSAALARLQAGERFDAVLCDVMMPELNGMELYREARQIDKDQAQRFIFVTGGVAVPQVHNFLAETGNPCVQKPFDLHTLRSTVRRTAVR